MVSNGSEGDSEYPTTTKQFQARRAKEYGPDMSGYDAWCPFSRTNCRGSKCVFWQCWQGGQGQVCGCLMRDYFFRVVGGH